MLLYLIMHTEVTLPGLNVELKFHSQRIDHKTCTRHTLNGTPDGGFLAIFYIQDIMAKATCLGQSPYSHHHLAWTITAGYGSP